MSKARVLGIAGLVALIALVMSPGALTEEQVLIIGTTDRITEISPANSYDYWTWHTLQQTSNALVTLLPYESTPSPSLAESWEVSEDGTVYTFKLRDGVTYTDGTPFDCTTMAWSLARNLKLNGPEGGVPLIGMIEEISCEVGLDEKPLTMRIKIKSPDATFIARLVDEIAPSLALSPATTPADEFVVASKEGDYAGTGPYKLIEYIPEERTVYEAYEGYWGDPPKTPKVIEVFYADAAALRAAVEAGEVDCGFRTFVPADIIDLEKKADELGLQMIKGEVSLSVRYIVFDVTYPPFDDVLVRRAISYAINRDELNNRVFLGLNPPLYSMVPPGLWSHIDAFPKRDLGKAQELLREAGYSEENPLKITLWYTPKHYGTEEVDVAAILKANLEETGLIEVEVMVLEWGTYIERMSEGTLGFFLLGWYPDFIDPDNFLAPWLTEAPTHLGTFLSEAITDYDKEVYQKFVELLEGAKLTTDIAERTALYEEAQRLLAESAVLIPLWSNNSAHLAICKKEVKGVVLDVSMSFRNWLIYKEE